MAKNEQMKTYRIGNEIQIKWPILTNGEEVSLDGRRLSLYLSDQWGNDRRVENFGTEGNIVVFTFLASEQFKTGVYRLTLFENEGLEHQTACDYCFAFRLVAHSCDIPADMTANELPLDSTNMDVGIHGLSAYEIAVNYGYEGSEEQWMREFQTVLNSTNLIVESVDRATHVLQRTEELFQDLSTIQQAEQGRVENEGVRVEHEQERVGNENQRVSAERTRQEKEEERLANERKRISDFNSGQESRSETFTQNEQQRQQTFSTNEQSRQQTFNQKQTERQQTFEQSETQRGNTFSDNEQSRSQSFTTAEGERQSTFEGNERDRQSDFSDAESQRQSTFETNESQRESRTTDFVADVQAAENLRINAEAERVENENDRKNKESTRRLNENTRQESETIRNQNESTRRSQEQNRVSNENERIENELLRQRSEQARLHNDDVIAEAEGLRQQAELRRIQSENERAAAELLREQAKSQMLQDVQTAIADFNRTRRVVQTLTEVEIQPNVKNIWVDPIAELTITFAEGISGYDNEYMIQFQCPDNEPTALTLPQGLQWVDDDPIDLQPGWLYQISIIDNLAIYAGWEAANV